MSLDGIYKKETNVSICEKKKTKNKNKTRKKQENNKGLVINIKEVIVE